MATIPHDRRWGDAITVDGHPTPWHTEVDGRRVAASAPIDATTLDLLRELDDWPAGVPRTEREATAAGRGPLATTTVGGDDGTVGVAGGRPAAAAGGPGGGGWRTDAFSVVLHREAPDRLDDGDPWFERGWAALAAYRMVDPVIVRGGWWADRPLLGRRIVQVGRFGPLRLRMATEVVAVLDGEVAVDGRVATVAGFEYRTLAGHLEDGWQSWQLWRWHDTGVLEHHGHTTSRRSGSPGPLIRLGMRVFGRGMQLLAGRRSTARLTAFVLGQGGGAVGPTPPEVDATPATRVRSLSSLPGARLLGGDEVAA